MTRAWVVAVLALSTVEGLAVAFQGTPPPEAQERLAKAREAAAKETADAQARDLRVAAILKEQTEAKPLKLDLGGGTMVDQVKVTGYANGRVKLAWPQGAVEFPLEALPKAARSALLDGLLTKGTPRDQFEVGRLLLKTGDFDLGQACIEKAVLLDAVLKPLAPDVDRLRRMARVFEAPFTLFGSSLQATWTFKRPEEVRDFGTPEGVKVESEPGGGLRVSGGSYANAVLRDVPFRDRLKVTATPVETPGSAHVVGIEFTDLRGETVFIYAAALLKEKAVFVNRLEGERVRTLLEPVPFKAGAKLELEFARGKVSFRSSGGLLWSGDEGGFLDVKFVLGAWGHDEKGEQAPTSSAVFRDLSLAGTVSPEWLKRRTLDYRAALGAELQRERRLDAGGVKPAEATAALSIDGPGAPPEYAGIQGALRRWLTSGEADDARNVSISLIGLTERRADFAPGWYWRGMLAEAGGERREADRCFGEALARKADFPEALCGRARLLAMRGEDAVARPLVEKALALRPDLAEGHVLIARLEHTGGRPAAALEAAAIARHLAPGDEDLVLRAKMMENAARGPAWTQAGRQESARFIVRGDVPAARLRAYADHLEAVRGHYEEMMGAPAAPQARKAEILVFASPEGYYSYLDITSGRRMENTLGVYNPWFGQMLIFEDADREETLRVASHEGFHQYLNGIAQDVPQWFNEGMAEYVGAAEVKNGKLATRGNLQIGRLIDLLSALQRGWVPIPFDEIMTRSKAWFYGKDASLKYAQAWSIIHFLMHAEKGRYQPILKLYVQRLLAGDGAKAAYDASVGKADPTALQALWLAYVKSFLREGGGGGTDLLKMIDLRQDVIRGAWGIAGGKLLSPPEVKAGAFSMLRVPYLAPEEYDLTMVVERREQNRQPNVSFDIGLWGPGGLFAIPIDAHGKYTYLNGAAGGEQNPVNRWDGRVFSDGKPKTIVFSVRKTGLTMTVDGAAALTWTGDLSAVRNDYGVPDKSCLFLGAWVQFAVSKLELVPVTGRGRKLR